MAELKKTSIKSKVEAVLFATGQRIRLDDISRLCRSRNDDVYAALQELRSEYDGKQSSLMLIEEGNFWKLTVRDHFIPIVRKIVTETELTKTVLETLAVIAFKYPLLQSELIKIRTNKAYDHLTELETAGYISRQKQGRTNLIKLTDKFFRYFDLTEENLKDRLKDFDSIARAIKDKEEQINKIKEEQRKKAEELKKEDERIKKEIDSLDESGEEFEVPVEMYEAKPREIVSEEFVNTQNLILEKEKIGELEVVEEGRAEKTNKRQKENEERVLHNMVSSGGNIGHVSEQKTKTGAESDVHKNKSEGIKLTPDMEAKVERRVEEILHPEKENKEEK